MKFEETYFTQFENRKYLDFFIVSSWENPDYEELIVVDYKTGSITVWCDELDGGIKRSYSTVDGERLRNTVKEEIEGPLLESAGDEGNLSLKTLEDTVAKFKSEGVSKVKLKTADYGHITYLVGIVERLESDYELSGRIAQEEVELKADIEQYMRLKKKFCKADFI
tara:strand:- start:9397 stop:9894 length:498 start_codon:yes stop_codon:yes gene_type:complete